jgi:bifunctional non-homologous end joining protein LigD
VRLFTRRGYDWTERYPAIAAAAAKVRAQSFTLDGEAVVCGADGIALFDAPDRHGTVREAILQTFDLLELMASTSGHCRSLSARRAWRGC